jgi:hypothetical protein
MLSGEDWLIRPVLRQMCKYESLDDGTLDLLDVANMNDAIDVENENKQRYLEAYPSGR